MMTVTQLAREARVSIRTVRFYEEKGIVGAAARTPGGQKRYDQPALLALKKVGLLKEAGMSVEEIRRTLRALSQHRTAGKVRQQAHLRLLSRVNQRIRERMRELQEMEEALQNALKQNETCVPCTAGDCAGCQVLDTWVRFAIKPTGQDVPNRGG
jgi:DNA-binding transcriptional MerR regulator